MKGLGFRVQGFRVQGFRVEGFRGLGFGAGADSLELLEGVGGCMLRAGGLKGLGLRVYGLSFFRVFRV